MHRVKQKQYLAQIHHRKGASLTRQNKTGLVYKNTWIFFMTAYLSFYPTISNLF